jgi:glycerol kinase
MPSQQPSPVGESNHQSPEDSSELIGAIDQGTTSSRFLVFNRAGEPIASHQVEFKQIYPNPGYATSSS